ncbi:MAG: UDP-glucose 4-epimerase GalE [Acidobacteria bacterium]|nr:MAG: UDP-glucose 4-epimerase GalE [Acidobacteriota bacterium]
MNILVAGGAGYIGGVMSELLLERGHNVCVYDNLSHGYRDAVPVAAHWVEGDVGDREKLERVFAEQRIEGVIHMAAFIEVGESVREPHKYLENNTLRAVALLQAMERAGVRLLVLSSTAAVYAPSAQPLAETAPLAPASPYGLSKLYLERLLAWYASRGLHYYALRYFNAAGATAQRGERHQPESHLIPLVLEAAAGERAEIQIFGDDYATPDGTCIRDYIHVCDLAEAHLLALDALRAEAAAGAAAGPLPDLAARAFNLGNGAGFSVREVIAAAEKVCGRPIPQRSSPRRSGDVDRLVADSTRMRALGWQPRLSDLETMIASAWSWKQIKRR